jgi:hypothetical protein
VTGIVFFIAGALGVAQNDPAPAPSLPYLTNPSVAYAECVAAAANGQADPRIAAIGAGPCRQPRGILWSAIRYHMAQRWGSIPRRTGAHRNRTEEARAEAQIDVTVRSIMASYETDLQHWLDTRAARP